MIAFWELWKSPCGDKRMQQGQLLEQAVHVLTKGSGPVIFPEIDF
jgi:hypothetical protein